MVSYLFFHPCVVRIDESLQWDWPSIIVCFLSCMFQYKY